MIYAHVKMSGGNTYIQPLGELENVIDEITEAAECNAVGRTWIIELVEMAEEKYEAMPEFEGH